MHFLAPLHNPYNLLGIKILKDYLPNVSQWAVFDTAFFADLPAYNKIYAIPQDLAQKYHIKKYGFHGIYYPFLFGESARILKKPNNSLTSPSSPKILNTVKLF